MPQPNALQADLPAETRSAKAILVIPPLFKTLNQPLLGPAMLAGAGRTAGHVVGVVDLNRSYLRTELGDTAAPESAPFIGDHNRPTQALRSLQAEFSKACSGALPPADTHGLGEDPALTLTYGHEDVLRAASTLVDGPVGRWIRKRLHSLERPDVLGVSVFWSGQVLYGLVVSLVARDLWPGVNIVWGGPHVTALEHQIAGDARYASGLIDGFVFGYAEATWVALLDAVAKSTPWPPEVVPAGTGRWLRAQDNPNVAPVFDGVDRYGWGRLCLPAQASRGCAYGRCAYCTYPTVEGRYRALPLDPVEAVVAQAAALGAAVSFKDALVVSKQMDALAEQIAGRVQWSACTKLHRHLTDLARLRRLQAAGLHTLEIGLETLTDDGQLLVNKRQALPLFLGFLDAAEAAGLAVVVNYMTGLPGLDALAEQVWLDRLRAEIRARPRLVAKVEHNTMQVERRSPMGETPGRFQLQVVKTWPWATVVAWRLAFAWAV